jgi:hypothetical protein
MIIYKGMKFSHPTCLLSIWRDVPEVRNDSLEKLVNYVIKYSEMDEVDEMVIVPQLMVEAGFICTDVEREEMDNREEFDTVYEMVKVMIEANKKTELSLINQCILDQYIFKVNSLIENSREVGSYQPFQFIGVTA